MSHECLDGIPIPTAPLIARTLIQRLLLGSAIHASDREFQAILVSFSGKWS